MARMISLLVPSALAIFLCSCTGRHLVDPGYPVPEARSATGVLHLHATYRPAYCGGAEPDPSDLRIYPWVGMMYLRAARTDSTGRFAPNDLAMPILDTIRTDAAGNGHLVLPNGPYLLLDRERVDDEQYKALMSKHRHPQPGQAAMDTACLRRWLHGPFGVVDIFSGDTTHVDLPLFGRCPWDDTPCLPYFGPYPP